MYRPHVRCNFSEGALPVPLRELASVPYKDSFLLIGGRYSETEEPSNLVLKFDVTDDTFKIVARLRYDRAAATAMLVDVHSFPDC